MFLCVLAFLVLSYFSLSLNPSIIYTPHPSPNQVKPYVQYKERRANWNGPGYNVVKSSMDEDLSISHLDVEELPPPPPPPPPRAPSPPPGPTALEQAAAIASGGPIDVGGGGGRHKKRKGSKSAQNSPGGGMHKGEEVEVVKVEVLIRILQSRFKDLSSCLKLDCLVIMSMIFYHQHHLFLSLSLPFFLSSTPTHVGYKSRQSPGRQHSHNGGGGGHVPPAPPPPSASKAAKAGRDASCISAPVSACSTPWHLQDPAAAAAASAAVGAKSGSYGNLLDEENWQNGFR